MKRLFSFMKDLVGGAEGSEEATEDLKCPYPVDEDAMKLVQQQEVVPNEGVLAAAAESESFADPGGRDSVESLRTDDGNEMDQGDPACDLQDNAEHSEGGQLEHQEEPEVSSKGSVRVMITDEDDDGSVGDSGDVVTSTEGEAAVDAADEKLASSHGGDESSLTGRRRQDLRTSNGGVSDTCSWEPKTKGVKVALGENGDNNNSKETGSWEVKHTVKQPDVIHPLQNSWGIWCFMQDRCQDWHENVRHISNFSSVEDFWSLFNHIQTVDNLPIGCDYYIFKANIQPMWEDRANVNGGRWLLKIPQSQQTFVHLWIETLLLLVGEAFEAESDSICGAVAQVRRGFNKISIWTRDASDRGACMRIGYRWKSCIKSAAPIHYEAHMEANRKGGRRSKSVYSIN